MDSIITLISVLIGYTLGRLNGVKIKEQAVKRYNTFKQEVEKKHSRVGAIEAPDARKLELLNNPKQAEEESELNKLWSEVLGK